MYPTSQIVGIHVLFRNLSQALYEHSTRKSLTVILQQVFMGGSRKFRSGGDGGPDTLFIFKFIIIILFFF